MRFIHWTPTAPLTFLLVSLAAAAAHAQAPAAGADGVTVKVTGPAVPLAGGTK